MIVIASDHGGFILKEAIKKFLAEQKYDVQDLGTSSPDSVDYPDFAHRLAGAMERREADMGILVCGSGIGMAMAANRHRGIRAAVCTNEYMAAVARKHNDANVLCLGERVVGVDLARAIVTAFLHNDFEGGRHERRVEKIEISG
jgi:ribose 5-phosphate isomerase B